MWIVLAFVSAFFHGCYDISKKQAVTGNAVMPVLFFNTVFCTLLLTPLFILSQLKPELMLGTVFYLPTIPFETHGYIIIKSLIVLASWMFTLTSVKHLPLTITGPISAGRPIITLLGAVIIFGERLNGYQWIGVIITILAFYLLSRSGKKEGINFTKDKWILFAIIGAILGASSGLYDKFLMQRFSSTAVQYWYNMYQSGLMAIVVLTVWYPRRKRNEDTTPFTWKWSIILVAVFLTAADFVYFYALTFPDAMVSIIGTVRRSSVVISFLGGAIIFREKNLKGKVIDLLLIIVAMFFLYLGTK